ncbi:MAG: undecaprenyl phosphate translocase family protein, partial [Acutalibacteraceae bacterium]
MALADSVPGVSGGTIALILGLYDNFIGAVHDLIYGISEQKKN